MCTSMNIFVRHIDNDNVGVVEKIIDNDYHIRWYLIEDKTNPQYGMPYKKMDIDIVKGWNLIFMYNKYSIFRYIKKHENLINTDIHNGTIIHNKSDINITYKMKSGQIVNFGTRIYLPTIFYNGYYFKTYMTIPLYCSLLFVGVHVCYNDDDDSIFLRSDGNGNFNLDKSLAMFNYIDENSNVFKSIKKMLNEDRLDIYLNLIKYYNVFNYNNKSTIENKYKKTKTKKYKYFNYIKYFFNKHIYDTNTINF